MKINIMTMMTMIDDDDDDDDDDHLLLLGGRLVGPGGVGRAQAIFQLVLDNNNVAKYLQTTT